MADSVADVLRSAGPGPHRLTTPHGPVLIADMTVTVDPDTGATVVEVYSGDFPDPHIRVINPPRYIPDPAGPVEMGGKQWRDDPLAALAHVIAQHGNPHTPMRRGM